MSAGEVAELYKTLQEIDVMLGHIEVKVDGIKTEAGHATGNIRELEYVLYRTLSILSRMGLPPEIDAGIAKMQRMIFTIRVLHSAMQYLTNDPTTPFGVAMGVISIGSALISMSDM